MSFGYGLLGSTILKKWFRPEGILKEVMSIRIRVEASGNSPPSDFSLANFNKEVIADETFQNTTNWN